VGPILIQMGSPRSGPVRSDFGLVQSSILIMDLNQSSVQSGLGLINCPTYRSAYVVGLHKHVRTKMYL